MKATVVTALVEIPGHPRPMSEYRELRRQLYDLPISIMSCDSHLQECWLHQYLSWRDAPVSWSIGDNPAKNSLGYHIVQAQKPEWLRRAAEDNPISDVFVWVDAGIFHLPGMTGDIIIEFLEKVASEKAIAIPGCWDENYTYDDHQPCWRFCGGLIAVPRQHIMRFETTVKAEYMQHLESTNHVSWEVNTLARVERNGSRLPLWHYKSEHDAGMFTNYRPADARAH